MNLKENIKKELRLVTEQPAGQNWDPCPNQDVHQWELCAYPGSTVSIAYPSWPGGSGMNFGSASSTHLCDDNENFYQSVGSPSVGQTIRNSSGGVNNPSFVWCWKYMGVAPAGCAGSNSGNCPGGWYGVGTQFTNPQSWGPFPDCATACQSCDTTPASACAQQWFQNPNASWAANWMASKDCTNYAWPATNLETQAIAIMAGAPTPQTGPYNNASDIWTAGQNSGLSPANQFIAKMAKAKYAQCQIQACNC